MLESVSDRLCEKGGAHHGSPDKEPAARLATMGLAGERRIPFTSGILIGIGETREERIDSLFALRDLNDQYGHIQEIIVQNFRPKAGTRMEDAASPDVEDHLWTIAIARLIFEPQMNIQAEPEPWCARQAGRGRHQRLGRGFAGDPGSCESRSALAASARA
jgi:FO synthase